MAGKKPTHREIGVAQKPLAEAQEAGMSTIFRSRIEKLTNSDFADFACNLELLSEHPVISGNDVLAGAVSAIKSAYIRLWNDVEAAVC